MVESDCRLVASPSVALPDTFVRTPALSLAKPQHRYTSSALAPAASGNSRRQRLELPDAAGASALDVYRCCGFANDSAGVRTKVSGSATLGEATRRQSLSTIRMG